MKPEHAFVAERPVARHCPELLRAPASREDTGPEPEVLALVGERLARALAAGLARFSRGEAPRVVSLPPRASTMEELAAIIAPLAANSLMAAGASAAPFLASIEAGVVLRLLDRAFGGHGKMPDPLPGAFPLSAELLIGRLETLVAGAVAQGLPAGAPIRPLLRDGSLAQVTPFAPAEMLTVLALLVEEARGASWSVTLAFPAAALAVMLGTAGQRAKDDDSPPADAAAPPFAELPLTVSALIVDMKLAFSTLSAIRPGDVLPVAVARSIPLRVGDKTIGHGTIGAIDDRVAVQLTQAFQ